MLISEQNLIKDDFLQKNDGKVTEREFEINYMESGMNVLTTINFIEGNIKRRQLNLPWKVTSHFGVCKLPTNDILFWGITRFILKFDGNISILPVERDNHGAGLCYYNASVYAFGGWDKHRIKDSAFKFDINKNKQIPIASMPKPSRFCSAVSFKGKLLISGKDIPYLYLYDPFINSYSKISLILHNLSHKILFKGAINGRVYLSQSLETTSKIFESLDLYHWDLAFTSQVMHLSLLSYVAYNENLVYFIDTFQRFYCFDLKLKILNEIRLN
ncbi:unnamed protein product [Blepharisma stoltei]|uniref:Uncharacterized protein n=1 Tax=Blepharisma stoltei TaxID=1481888 RepID=A0AAU9K5I5_9CILI|nr:unnamed protein product [Blepharisma stoltei]